MNKEKIKEYIIKNNGVSLNSKGELINNNFGYIVSVEQYTSTTKNINDAIDILLNYTKCLDIVKNKNTIKSFVCGVCAGVWLSDGVYYIDINIIYKNKEKAIQKAKKEKQKAIFDIKNNKDINLNYNFTSYAVYKNIYKNGVFYDNVFMFMSDTFKDIKTYYNDKKNYTIEKVILNIIEYHKGV